HNNVEACLGVLAENAVGAGLAVGGERTGITAFRIIRAADESTELSGLQVELAGAAGRALPDIAAIRARRIDVRPEHVVEYVQYLRDAQILDFLDRAG